MLLAQAALKSMGEYEALDCSALSGNLLAALLLVTVSWTIETLPDQKIRTRSAYVSSVHIALTRRGFGKDAQCRPLVIGISVSASAVPSMNDININLSMDRLYSINYVCICEILRSIVAIGMPKIYSLSA